MSLITGAARVGTPPSAHNGYGAPPAPPGVRRRAPRTAAVGLLLAVTGALLFTAVELRTDPATAVLTVARAVPAGSVITEADLAVARIVPDPGLTVVPDTQRSTVLGRTAAVPLVAGSLLSPKQVGASAWPPRGQSVIAVAVKGGRAPSGMAVGSTVTVLVVAPQTATGSDDRAGENRVKASATVVSLATTDTSGVRVVSLLLSSSAALQVSAAPGDVSLIMQGVGE